VRPDKLERRLQERLDALGPAPPRLAVESGLRTCLDVVEATAQPVDER
jgi:hypothetical protein